MVTDAMVFAAMRAIFVGAEYLDDASLRASVDDAQIERMRRALEAAEKARHSEGALENAGALYKNLMATCERWSDEDAAEDIPAIARAIMEAEARGAEREREAIAVEADEREKMHRSDAQNLERQFGFWRSSAEWGRADASRSIATAIRQRGKDNG